MNRILGGIALAASVALTLPAWSQTSPTPGQPIQQNTPSAGGVSKPGLPGLPGSKSGPSGTSSGTTRPENRTQPSGDQSGVKRLPGNKSGPAVKPSQSGR
jgi:hypothetical protein